MPKHKHHDHHHSHHEHHGHHSGHSHKNTSMGHHGHGHGDSGADYIPIKEYRDPHPPAGASNSYERVRKAIDHHDDRSLAHGHYTREKMMNK